MANMLKTITIRMMAGANVATVIIMLMVGFADYINPVNHPLLSCLGMTFPALLIVNMAFLFFWLTFKKRMALIPVAGYVLAYVPIRIYMPVNLPEDMPDGVIKVLSYNVQAYNGNSRYDDTSDMIVDYIRDSEADIVCLQEDMTRAYILQRMDSLYAHRDTVHVGTRNMNALGIYSRYPILSKERIGYASEGNGSVAIFLDVDGDTVIVINNHLETTHLSLKDRRMYKSMLKGNVRKDTVREESKKLINRLGESAAIRAPQADAVRKYIADHADRPIILCGDFNDNPISYARRTVAKGLTDCYVATGRGVGVSYNQSGFYVRIDNLMCSGDFKPYNCKVDNKIDASDHYPIYCWLKKQDKP